LGGNSKLSLLETKGTRNENKIILYFCTCFNIQAARQEGLTTHCDLECIEGATAERGREIIRNFMETEYRLYFDAIFEESRGTQTIILVSELPSPQNDLKLCLKETEARYIVCEGQATRVAIVMASIGSIPLYKLAQWTDEMSGIETSPDLLTGRASLWVVAAELGVSMATSLNKERCATMRNDQKYKCEINLG